MMDRGLAAPQGAVKGDRGWECPSQASTGSLPESFGGTTMSVSLDGLGHMETTTT
jgi:hypothetical protein